MTALPAPPGAIDHLSASSITDYLRCPLGWYGTRIAHWPQEPVFVMEAGVAIHKALTAYHENRDADMELLEAWKAVTASRPDGALERAVTALGLYRDRFTPKTIDVVDWWFKARIPGINIPFIGAYDLVRADTERPKQGIIVDWKTGRAAWKQQKADSELQATAYWFAYHQETEHLPDRFVYVLLATELGSPSLRTLTTRRTEDDLDQFVDTCQTVYRRILTEEPRPLCNPKWCRFPDKCAEYR